ncbi:MAG: HAMP domain-containing protein [Myxococcaceae bacterium]
MPAQTNGETIQVKELLRVLGAVKRGDFTVRMTAKGAKANREIAAALNAIIELNQHTATQFEELSTAVGREGRITYRAKVLGKGAWADKVRSVNAVVDALAQQNNELSKVFGAVAEGDLSETVSLGVDGRKLKGEFLRTAQLVNGMVEQLSSFASEVTRVAREVGTEGKLGGQAQVVDVGGIWKDLTDNVNSMATNLTTQVRNIADVTTAVAKGDLSKKITVDVRGEILELKNTMNTMVDQLSSFASEVNRVAREVGTEGKLGGQAEVRGVGGVWRDLTDNVNSMSFNLATQVKNVAEVTTAVQKGDLSRKVTVEARGEILELKKTINTMVDQLSSFASEVTRVAREVGTEGKLGGQAVVRGVAGTWKDLTDNVNSMASNLTIQVRGIAKVATHLAMGDLKRKLVLEVKGEIAELADTINGMIDTLAMFSDQVTTVAREVGIEGKLGGQARVPGAAGIWRDLTNNVNQLAGNLTAQVRSIAEVATAVATGDLTRSVTITAEGEVAALKDNINEMIRNLKDTTRKNNEQDWLKTNLTRFGRVLQGERDQLTVSKVILSELCPLVGAQYGAFYVFEQGEHPALRLRASYAHGPRESEGRPLKLGEGLVGQCAEDKQPILMTGVPAGYVQISSGLGVAGASSVAVFPVLFEGEIKAVVELGSFGTFSAVHLDFVSQLTESIGIVLNTIGANMRTETLLAQSQALTEELTEINKRLEQQKTEVEHKNREVEQAKIALEEKAEQLSLASKYKSEFLANVSHELRTPLNSLLLLSQNLAENADGNLTSRQVQFARAIKASGTDLLELIDDILDLAKIESGTVAVNIGTVSVGDVRDFVDRGFRQLAEKKNLQFDIHLGDHVHRLETDAKRLQQVLRNLLSNAFKFTEKGRISLKIEPALAGWSREHPVLSQARQVVAFSVTDTGIGIPREKHQLIFEAFQQADGTTSRKYGGTGLGLSICRELAHLLGGEIRVESEVGVGSTFTLYLPQRHASLAAVSAPPMMGSREPTPTPFVPRKSSDSQPGILPLPRDLIVVATSNSELARHFTDVAEQLGLRIQVTEATDAAIEPARQGAAAVVIDHGLPGRDAWVLLDRLKHDAQARQVPVLLVGPPETEEPAAQAGVARRIDPGHGLADVAQTLKELTQGPIVQVSADVLEPSQDDDRALVGRSVLVVDDDVRNIFAITALLERHGMVVHHTERAIDGLELLERAPIDLVLMDVMMPEMDGYQAMRSIRARPAFAQLPVIALTAKAMKGDREKCLAAGASDYIAKPVNVDKLISLIRVWLGARWETSLPAAQTPQAQA